MNKPTKSKINFVALLMSLVTLGLIAAGATAEVKAEVLTVTGIVGPVLIGVFRTYFTDKGA